MNSLCQTVMQHFAADTPLVLATIMDQSGSAPRTAGARMLVLPDASITGTIGGGRYEAEAIAAAATLHDTLRTKPVPANTEERLREDLRQPGRVLEFSLHGSAFKGDMDMICGGSLSLLLELLPDAMTMRGVFSAARAAEKNGEAFVFITHISRTSGILTAPQTLENVGTHATATVQRFVFLPHKKGLVIGPVSLPQNIVRLASQLTSNMPQHIAHEGEEYLLEFFPQPHRIHIFGGGHVSCELSKLTHGVGFHTTALDDRPEFASEERFPSARVEVLASLEQQEADSYLSRQKIGKRDGIVIVTRGHAHDRDVLAAALGTEAGYIGMIGSKSKRTGVYNSLREAGFTDADFARVHSPIGLSIGAETPQEIAVSIVAELIQWRKES